MPTKVASRAAVQQSHTSAAPKYRVGYARVSEPERRAALLGDSSKSIERQVATLKLAHPDMEIHIDDGVSGTKVSREAWDRCVAEAKANAPAEIWCVWLDRIGRNHGLKELLSDLYYEHNIQIKATDDTVPSLDEDYGSLVFDLRINMNCEESDRIGKRIRAGNEHVFRQNLNNRAHPGYLLYRGNYYPDDKPQHCPLPQRKECSGPVDQWGIHLDAHEGFSNFELLRLQVAYAIKNDLLHEAAVQWMLKNFPITRVERWDPAKGRTHHAHVGMEVMEAIHEINGDFVIAKSKPWGTLARGATTLANRCQSLVLQGFTAHRRDYNPNARPSRQQRTCSNNPHLRYEDANFAFMSEKRTHVPVIDDELKAYLDAANRRFREDKAAAAVTSGSVGRRSGTKSSASMSPTEAKRYELSAPIFRNCICQGCGSRMHRSRSVVGGKVYASALCRNEACAYEGLALKLDNAIAGIALHLAQQAKALQGGELESQAPAAPLHPAKLAQIESYQEDLAYFRNRPANQVRLNQIAELERLISDLQSDVVNEQEDLRAMDARRRLRHPRAAEANTWMQLLTESTDTVHLVNLAVAKVLVAPRDPEKFADCKGKTARWGERDAVVTAVELA